MNNNAVLVVDDEKSLRRILQVQLEQRGYTVTTAENGTEALARLRAAHFGLIISDLRMPGFSGLDLLKEIRHVSPQSKVIILTAFGTVETAVEAMQNGAYHYVTKPVNFNELSLVVERAFEHVRLLQEVNALRESINERYGFDNIVGRSGSLLAVLDIASRAARSSSTVLIEGETGTGKELLARAIHFAGPRRDRPFVAINCGAIPRDLLESELFGYRKGAFTGALDNKQGQVELANKGTLFLDEIGELPLNLQVKLLRLIQEGEMQKLGAVEPTKVDVRIIAATNRNLRQMTDDGEFREDLYYRLAVIPMTLPPVRERIEDIPELLRHFWRLSMKKHGRDDLHFPEHLLPVFSHYHWPGNIRELENVVERMVVLTRGPKVAMSDLPEALKTERTALDSLRLELPPHPINLDNIEKELILRAAQRFQWNQTKTAEYLGLTRKKLIYRMEKHGIKKE
jgi:two-component system NtrC family response regulator